MAYYKKVLQKRQVSTDGGETWTYTGEEQWVTVGTYNTLEECEGASSTTRWIDNGLYVCEGYDKYTQQKEQISYDGGTTWNDTGAVRRGTLVERNSVDCGYVPQDQFKAKLTNGSAQLVISCNGSPILSPDEIPEVYYGSDKLEVGTCVTQISNDAFGELGHITSATIPNTVTSIGHGAFQNCRKLKSIVIPNSVTSIGYDAFRFCSELTSITLSNRLTILDDDLLSSAYALSSITIPNGVTRIGIATFEDCSSLTSITLPESVEEVYNNAFSNCESLEFIEFLGNRVGMSSGDPFINTNNCPIYVPCDAITEYRILWPNYADRLQCRQAPTQNTIAKLTLSNGQTVDINSYDTTLISEDVKQYSATTVSAQVTTACTGIGYAVFRNFDALTSATIPNSVSTVGDMVFAYCENLKSFTIPTNPEISKIPNDFLMECRSLTSIVIPSNILEIGNYAFSDCTGLTSVTFQTDYISRIGWQAFQHCINLKKVNLPTVDNIDNGAFENCVKLSAVTLSNGESGSDCEKIGNGAFKDCEELRTVTLNQDVLLLSDNAFEGCTSLQTFTNVMCRPAAQTPWPKVTKLGTDVFKDVTLPNVTFKVPGDCITNYQDEWGSDYNFVAI